LRTSPATMKDRTWLTQLIIQPIMIVLSILAALAVNNWQQDRDLAKRVADARTAFANEISVNKQMLLAAGHLPHHQKLRTEYAEAKSKGAPDPRTLFDTGLHPAPLRDSVWRMLSGTDTLMHLPPEVVVSLTDIYGLQKTIENSNAAFINSLLTPRSDRDTPAYAKDVTVSVSMFLEDLVPAEDRLLRFYDKALDGLTHDKPPWARDK
jgi:type II secretory pathway pseudopilin PulG